MLAYSFIVVNKHKNYCNLKDIDMSISPTEKFIILTANVALLTKIFMGKKANLVKFIWFVRNFCQCFAADLNLRKIFFRSTCRHLFLWRVVAPITHSVFGGKHVLNIESSKPLIGIFC